MKKMKFGKFGILTLGLAIVSMLIFSLPLMGSTAATEENTAIEDTSVEEDLDDVQEEVEEIGENDDLDEAEEASDADEADEDLAGGGHEDADGTDVEHEFEGIE